MKKKLLLIFSFTLVLTACQSTSPEEELTNLDIADNSTEDNFTTSDENLDESIQGDSGEATGLNDQAEPEDIDLDVNETMGIEGKIIVDEPLANSKVASPLIVKGEVLGNWFFEGSFPVKLVDEQGEVLATGSATSPEDWMTEDMIPFNVELTFDPGAVTLGKIILEKDNPSGLPENAGKLEIPVRF